METIQKDAHLVKQGEIILYLPDTIWYVLGTLDSWDGGVMFHVLDLMEGEVSFQFFSAFEWIDVLA